MRKLAFHNVCKQTLLGDSVGLEETSAERRQGLLKRDGLGHGEGLWIVPCEAIHTFFMRFPIDVVFLNKDKRVTKLVSRMKSSRLSLSWRARSVVELPGGVIEQTRTEVGDLIEIRERDG